MPERIEDLLQRRTDLSTYLVHLTKEYQGRDGRADLLKIIDDRRIQALNPYGMGVALVASARVRRQPVLKAA